MGVRSLAVAATLYAVLFVGAPAAARGAGASGLLNVALVIADNMRPSLGCYGVRDVVTPEIDRFAVGNGSTLFAGTHCQIAWCAPSRNSFLSGRRPRATRSYNFVDDFRTAGVGGAGWTTLPGWFRAHNYYTTSVGKVFHPDLPAAGDARHSWSDAPYLKDKPPCPDATMSCELPPSGFDVDRDAVDVFLSRIRARPTDRPFFAALGLQSNRLPWVYPASAAVVYPPAAEISVAAHATARLLSDAEYFRPTEVDLYADVRNVTHDRPMGVGMQHVVRRAYYTTMTHVDGLFGEVLRGIEDAGLAGTTVVALVADHGQNLGENNLWSMMAVLDTATQVPMIIRTPRGMRGRPHTHTPPTELVDLMPTLGALAGLPPPPPAWHLPGTNLASIIHGGPHVAPGNPAAFSQITRCLNCTEAYSAKAAQCTFDAAADAGRYYVPCCFTPRDRFDLMGVSIRTADWRYTAYCEWDRTKQVINPTACEEVELFDHRGQHATPWYRPDVEWRSVAHEPRLRGVRDALHARLMKHFMGSLPDAPGSNRHW